jgi:cyanate lyase
MRTVCKILGVDSEWSLSQLGSHWWPNRGLGPMPPTDPVIYRLYEVCVHAFCVGDAQMPFTERSRLWTCYQGELSSLE